MSVSEDDDWKTPEQEFSNVLNPGDYGRLGGGGYESGKIMSPEEKAVYEFQTVYEKLHQKQVPENITKKLYKLNITMLNMEILAHVSIDGGIKQIIRNYGSKINKYDLVRYFRLWNGI